ncbi:MAG: SIR2 family protein [Gemmatimonadota bacterium]|nr:SIR2 family protein [Gemmatimonadota bacterium]
MAVVYQAALDSGRPLQKLKSFLEDRLLTSRVPEWYHRFAGVFWYRIYTTNVDDVIETAYQDSGIPTSLCSLSAPKQDYRERDQFLESIQYIKLNGSLPGDPRDLTFATRQYAERIAHHDTWYSHFVRDYIWNPTVFIGTDLDEPNFWRALADRQRRGDNPEERPRSFLITPNISPARVPTLATLNVNHVPGTAEDFSNWLGDNYRFPVRMEVLRLVVPEEADALALAMPPGERDALVELISVFRRVPRAKSRSDQPKEFFLGTPPTWTDIAADFDAPRDFANEVSSEISYALKQPAHLRVIGLTGSGGSGKTTTMMRVALTLRQAGREVLFSEGVERPDIPSITKGLTVLGTRAILFIDNAHLLSYSLLELLKALRTVPTPPVVVFAARYSLFERNISEVVGFPNLNVLSIPDLSGADIVALLETLERHRQLGTLEPKTHNERVRAFKIRARKQILVAMREATQGKGFDDIIRSEFGEIDNQEARVLYLCAALATAELIDLGRGQWIACAMVPAATAIGYLSTGLKGLLVRTASGHRIAARHAVIAALVVDRIAGRNDLVDAYCRVLSALSQDIYRGEGRRGRSWRLFVRLIDHRRIFERFSQDMVKARTIYESIGEWFRADGHYWLQFASLEIEYGELDYARLHLAHAEGLMPRNPLVVTTRALLTMKEAIGALHYDEAKRMLLTAQESLEKQIESKPRDDYPYHVYLSQTLLWVDTWEWEDRGPKLEWMRQLMKVAAQAEKECGGNPRIKEIVKSVKRSYLMLGVSE